MVLKQYAKIIGRRPCCMLSSVWGVILILSLATFMLDYFSFASPSDGEWAVSSALTTENMDAYEDATSKDGLHFETIADVEPVNRTDSDGFDDLMIMYNDRQGNVFTPTNLRRICELEQIVVGHPDYPDYCVVANLTTRECAEQTLSVTFQFYGKTITKCTPELTQTSIDATVAKANERILNGTGLDVYFFLADDYIQLDKPPGEWVNKRTRSQFLFGSPVEEHRLPGKGEGDIEEEQRELYEKKWWKPLQDRLFRTLDMKKTWLFSSPYEMEAYLPVDTEREGMTKNDRVDVRFISAALASLEFQSLVNTDLLTVTISIIFVYTYMVVHLGSFFMASMSLLQMIFSIPISLFVYRGIFGIVYFSNMHILVMFLVLGVGADDVFVFIDKFKLTNKALPLNIRMQETVTHTAWAVFNTSFTTIVAFMSTAISPIMPISAFGIFSSLTILFNYIFVIVLTPCVVVIWVERYAEYTFMESVCCCFRFKYTNRTGQQASTSPKARTGLAEQHPEGTLNESEAQSVSLDDAGSKGVPKFFHHIFVPMLNRRKWGVKLYSILIVIAGILLFSITTDSASKLKPPTEQEKWFRESHMFTAIDDYARIAYAAGTQSRYMSVDFVIGIEGINRSGYVRWTPSKNRGKAVYYTSLHDSLSNTTGQRNFIKACEILREAKCMSKGCKQGPLGDSFLFSPESLVCVLEDYVDWVTGGNESMALPEGDAFSSKLIEFLNTKRGSVFYDTVGFDDSVSPARVQLIVIKTVASIFDFEPNNIVKPYYDFTKALIENEIKPLAANSGDTFLTCVPVDEYGVYSFMVTQDKLVSGLFNGFLITFPVVFLVLLGATSNLLLAIYATFTIAAIVSGVLGVAKWLGWVLGIAETIAAVMVVGFSVDYSVHLVHIYAIAPNKADRGARVDEALTRMGHTVIAGAITTFGSGAAMFLASMTFFFKMAVLICLTISLSTVYSELWLMALLALLGPQNRTGDIRRCLPCKSISKPKQSKLDSVKPENAVEV